MRITSGNLACEFPLEANAPITWGTTEDIQTGRKWKFTPADGRDTPTTHQARVNKTPEFIEIAIPAEFFGSNPDAIAIEWLKP